MQIKLSELAEVVGAPYTSIPPQMMDWAGAGVVGFGTLCGTLNGTAAAIGLICSGQDARAFVSDLLTWYSETELPTNLYAPGGVKWVTPFSTRGWQFGETQLRREPHCEKNCILSKPSVR